MTVDSIAVSVIAGKTMVFQVEDIKRVRALGIVGTLSGTLPAAPQQNMFLGVPLLLMPEECLWLLRHGHAHLVPDDRFIRDIYTHLTDDDVHQLKEEHQLQLEAQREVKIAEHTKKMAELGVTTSKHDHSLIAQGLSITVPDTPEAMPNYELFRDIYEKSTRYQESLVQQLPNDELSYNVFKYLRYKGYFLAPGLRFGGKFIGYPGDPLRFHAHLIINTVPWKDDIGMINFIGGGRLATGVKKLWVMASQPEDKLNDDIQCFSIEWAGFG